MHRAWGIWARGRDIADYLRKIKKIFELEARGEVKRMSLLKSAFEKWHSSFSAHSLYENSMRLLATNAKVNH